MTLSERMVEAAARAMWESTAPGGYATPQWERVHGSTQQRMLNHARAALTAALAVAEGAGVVLAPVQPTFEQQDCALHDMGCPNPKMSRQQLRDFYRAMIVAAKEPMQ